MAWAIAAPIIKNKSTKFYNLEEGSFELYRSDFFVKIGRDLLRRYSSIQEGGKERPNIIANIIVRATHIPYENFLKKFGITRDEAHSLSWFKSILKECKETLTRNEILKYAETQDGVNFATYVRLQQRLIMTQSINTETQASTQPWEINEEVPSQVTLLQIVGEKLSFQGIVITPFTDFQIDLVELTLGAHFDKGELVSFQSLNCTQCATLLNKTINQIEYQMRLIMNSLYFIRLWYTSDRATTIPYFITSNGGNGKLINAKLQRARVAFESSTGTNFSLFVTR